MVRPINDDIIQNDSEYRSEPVDFPNRKYRTGISLENYFEGSTKRGMDIYQQA
jgi:hypothetical protein